jgi:hypothetical protein
MSGNTNTNTTAAKAVLDLGICEPPTWTKPNLGNATPMSLTDEIGFLRRWESFIEKQKKFLEAALKARLDDKTTCEGEFWSVEVIKATQTRVSADLARERLSPQILASIQNQVTMNMMKFTRKGQNSNVVE